MKQATFFWLTLSFCIGIIVSNFLSLSPLILVLTLILSLVFCFFTLKIANPLSKTKFASYTLLLMLFLLGMIRYSVSNPDNYKYSLKNNYLKNDLILGEIQSLTPTQGEYMKTEFSVKKIIRFQDTIPVNSKIVLFMKDDEKKLKEFDVCLLSTDLMEIKNKNNPGEFDSELFWKHREIEFLAFVNEDSYQIIGKSEPSFSHIFTEWRNYFAGILDKHLTGNELGIAKALILGDRSSLDIEITAKFGNTGAMHVLAVSGLHVGILVQILTLFLNLFKKWISKNQIIIIALVIVWIYSLMTGLSASVARSAVMFTLLVGSGLLNRSQNNFNVLAFSAFLILMWNPHFLYDIGFQLSYLAMFGIFMFYKPLGKLIYFKNKIIRLAYEGTMVGIAAQVLTVPLTLYYFHQFPNYFIITNLGLMIFSFLILALGIALFSFNWLAILGKFFAYILFVSLFVMILIIEFIDGLPGAVASGFVLNSVLVLLLFAVIFVFYYALQNEKMKLLKITLVSSTILITSMIYTRFNQLNAEKICFLQSDEPTFIIKHEDKNLVFYANKELNTKKAKFSAKSFATIYPGKSSFFEISTKKETHIS
ncbi:MAG: ComEC/Rec2 family competence protein [Bacteroidota bacterium]